MHDYINKSIIKKKKDYINKSNYIFKKYIYVLVPKQRIVPNVRTTSLARKIFD